MTRSRPSSRVSPETRRASLRSPRLFQSALQNRGEQRSRDFSPHHGAGANPAPRPTDRPVLVRIAGLSEDLNTLSIICWPARCPTRAFIPSARLKGPNAGSYHPSVRILAAVWAALVGAGVAGCAKKPCLSGPIKVSSPPSLACTTSYAPGLQYQDLGSSLQAALFQRQSVMSLVSAKSTFNLIANGDVVQGEGLQDGDSRALSLQGGPCDQGCDVTPGFSPAATPHSPVSPDGKTSMTGFAAFGGLPRLCLPAGDSGTVPAGAATAAFNGFTSGAGIYYLDLANPEPLSYTVDFAARTMSLKGDLCDTQGSGWGVELFLSATIVETPPVAVAGPDQQLNCASPNGTSMQLDGSQSWGQTGEPLYYVWWQGQAGSSQVVKPLNSSPTVSLLLQPGSWTYTLGVMESTRADFSTAPINVAVRPNCP